jgi:hypothetical protein
MPPPPQAPQKPAGRLRSLRLRRASLRLLPVLGPRCRRGPPPRRRCPRPGLVQEAQGPPKLLPAPLLLPVRWTMWENGVVRQRWSRRRSKRRKHPRLTGRSLRDRRRRRWHGMSLLVLLSSGRHWQLTLTGCVWRGTSRLRKVSRMEFIDVPLAVQVQLRWWAMIQLEC